MISLMVLLQIFFFIHDGFGQEVTLRDDAALQSYPSAVPSSLQDRRCEQELGMKSGDITDDNIAVSSTISGARFGKENARLNGESAWLAKAMAGQWVQVDLGEYKYVSGVKTQGKILPFYQSHFVTSYKVLYKMYPQQSRWFVVSDDRGKPTVFSANSDATSVKTNIFQRPLQAQIIRINIMSWSQGANDFALRLELLGCGIQVESGCNSPEIMTNPEGSIFSMNYPNTYDNNANCHWVISAPPEKVISLEFVETFDIEPNNCKLEYVEVLDVIGITEQSFGKFCGKGSPGKFVSTNNQMKVHFMTDHYEAYMGFKARYKFLNGSGCGGAQILKEASGYFQSMNYPENYNNFANCLWEIQTETDKLIEIKFSVMKVRGESPACNDDLIQVIDIGGSSSNIEGLRETRLCGINPPSPLLSTTNRLRITFSSNEMRVDKGFHAIYKSVYASRCGTKRDLTEPSGTIETLNYPQPYPANMHCEWNIMGGPDQDIKIKFLDFDLEEYSDCKYDSVSIYDGRSERHLLGKYCHKLNIQPLVAHSGAMKIVFLSDQHNSGKGFRATYVVIPRQTATRHHPTTSAINFSDSMTMSRHSTRNYDFVNTLLSASRSTPLSKTFIKSTTTKKTKTNHLGTANDNKNPYVTKDLIKWIVIGLISVAGLLIVVIVFGVILCCKQQLSNSSVSIRSSTRNDNSGPLQNHAYDFSGASTSQSIRSRQQEAAESSQVSETISHQDILRNDSNRDSHIYFSIDDYRSSKQSGTSQGESSNVKVQYRKCQARNDATTSGSDDIATVAPLEDDYDIESDPEEQNTLPMTSGSSSRSNTLGSDVAASSRKTSLGGAKSEPSKMMVENILYESANSIDETDD